LERRALGDATPHSLLEVRMAEVMRKTGVRFEYQFPLVLDGRRYRLDFAVPSLLVCVEADGLSAHGERRALDADLERQNRLLHHGWTVRRYTHTHLKHPHKVRDEIVEAIHERQEPSL